MEAVVEHPKHHHPTSAVAAPGLTQQADASPTMHVLLTHLANTVCQVELQPENVPACPTTSSTSSGTAMPPQKPVTLGGTHSCFSPWRPRVPPPEDKCIVKVWILGCVLCVGRINIWAGDHPTQCFGCDHRPCDHPPPHHPRRTRAAPLQAFLASTTHHSKSTHPHPRGLAPSVTALPARWSAIP